MKILKIVFLILIFIISIICGYFVAQNIKVDKIAIPNEDAQEKNISIKNEIKRVNSEEEKIGINTKVLLKITYEACGHEEEEEIDKLKVINLNKEELQNLYKDCKIIKFSKEEVILEKNVEDLCGEHYIISEKDGRIVVYKILLDEEGEKMQKVYLETDISTAFLPEEDYDKIKNGIEIYSREELNKFLEDYE